MAYRTIEESFWTDPDVKKLEPLDKLIFLYLITNPQAHYSGIYYLPLSFIIEETGLIFKTIKQHLNNLEPRFILYDLENSTIFIRRMCKYQIRQGGNPKVLISGIDKQLKNLHSKKLILEFYKEYQHLNITLPQGCNNVESTLVQGTVPVPVPVKKKIDDLLAETLNDSFPDWLDLKAWGSYCEMRRKIKKPMTDRAMELAMEKLGKFRDSGIDPTDVLNNSIESSYQGLFEPKNYQRKEVIHQTVLTDEDKARIAELSFEDGSEWKFKDA